jgi:tRNA pseudouridine32 synthase/23S rRNA pseudouridine746 synthase
MPIAELFRDERFVVLNKPAGLKVHPGPGGGPSVEDIFPRLTRRRDGPWLVHRLDANTAGCLVVALRKAALLAAQALFVCGKAEKTYWAVVQGSPPTEAGRLELPLRRVTGPSGWRMQWGPGGDPAVTEWRVRGRGEGITWLELRPRTGRTHQVRIHCAALGCPILGDSVYGAGQSPLHLLARAIRLPLDPPLEATAPVPSHMTTALLACGFQRADQAC